MAVRSYAAGYVAGCAFLHANHTPGKGDSFMHQHCNNQPRCVRLRRRSFHSTPSLLADVAEKRRRAANCMCYSGIGQL